MRFFRPELPANCVARLRVRRRLADRYTPDLPCRVAPVPGPDPAGPYDALGPFDRVLTQGVPEARLVSKLPSQPKHLAYMRRPT
eukprot:813967-Prymnesium_polylepis.1